MEQFSDRQQLINEINLIPESHLPQLFDLLHYFRLGLQATDRSNIEAIMSHAGDWEDLDDETAEDFEAAIKARRAQAFIRESTEISCLMPQSVSVLASLAGSWEGDLVREPQGKYEQRLRLEQGRLTDTSE